MKFPKSNSLGLTFDDIYEYVKNMLESNTEDQSGIYSEDAQLNEITFPEKDLILQDIFLNTKYYAGYF